MPKIRLAKPGPHTAPKLLHPARHVILCAGRRYHKTSTGLYAGILGRGPIGANGIPLHRGAIHGMNGWLIDQSHPAAMSLWFEVRDILRPIAEHISEANRRVELPGGGAITIKSAANVNSLVGDIRGLDFAIMNEGAKFNPLVWRKAIRPALSDRLGWSFWPSTPEGLNYYYDLFGDAADADDLDAEWVRWQAPSTDNPYFQASEIEKSRREGMSDLLIRQEYFAEFVLMGAGRAYYEFVREVHVPEAAVEQMPSLPIDLCVSFAAAPAAMLVTQAEVDGSGKPTRERVLAEIVAASGDPSTRALLAEFRRQFPQHSFGQSVRVYGEVSGRSTGHSDFEALRSGLPRARFYEHDGIDEKDRTNAVNLVLRDGTGRVRAAIHPECHRLIKDLEGTRNSGGTFAIDHRSLGAYAAAWGAKLHYVYPALLETLRVRREEYGRWPVKTPEAKRAHDVYWAAVKRGEIVRPDKCDQCGAFGPVDADHRDYSRPLDVTHVCRSCHSRMPPAGGTVSSARH